MASVYYKNRIEAGKKIVEFLALEKMYGDPAAIVSLNTNSLLVALQVAFVLKCPLHLYLSEGIKIPGNVQVGSVNQEGQFSYGSDLGAGYSDYYYQEFRNYIEDNKRDGFSKLNRELGGREVLRVDLLRKRTIYVVVDCLEQVTSLDSFLSYARTMSLSKVIVCAPLAMANDLSHLQQVSDKYFVEGVLDFFFGADHYFEDNTVIERNEAIEMVSRALATWPAK